MAKPKSRNIGRKNRNHQFFEGLSGLARGIDGIIANTKRVSGGNSGDPDRMVEAERKRKRKAIIRLRDAGMISRDEATRRLEELS